ncbi:FkbM family methyltransferase [Tabrizicola sp. YIM 78059]|uniref:FkbM family methyltransferase n=1 Tax=Tabrizicola sp. YIM 78059 TaxID=2529861 RepID=UPI0010AB3EC0|nr:FkbM family methyltransferase [Tabrizicola sp. YIM 78059]
MTNHPAFVPSGVRVAVMTHARKEPFFCALFSRHYGALFGTENLFLYKDGEDWELPADATFGTVIPVTFPSSRTECDAYFAEFLSAESARLLTRYDIVLRVDVDEFLVVDPAQGSWTEVVKEAQDNGYLYAIGLDVVQNRKMEGPLRLDVPILEQRSYAYFRGDYCKPCAIARAVVWTSACHTVHGEPVVLSKSLKLIHLASMDQELLQKRLEDRGDFAKASYSSHAKSRFRQFETVGKDTAFDLDAIDGLIRQRLCFDDVGAAAHTPRFTQVTAPDGTVRKKSLCVRLPKRYAPLIAAPAADQGAVQERIDRGSRAKTAQPPAEADRLRLLLDLLAPERKTVIADVGASGSKEPPYAFLLKQGACQVWGFEPQPEEYAKLVAAAGPNEHYLPSAVGDGTVKRLHLTSHPGFSSTLVPNQRVSRALQRRKKDMIVQSVIDVPTVRLDDVAGLPQIDLLKIDVSGGEIDVFLNATTKLAGAIAVITETSALPIYENQPLLGDQMVCLNRLGFQLHKFSFFRSVPFRGKLTSGVPRRARADQLSDGGAIFVRKLFDFESQPTEALKHLAILADFIFASRSLALKSVEVLMDRGVIAADGARKYAAAMSAKHRSPERRARLLS